MTLDIDAIEARANAATPGPWKYVDTEDGLFGVEMDAGHNILWDMEGTCDKCFGNMRFIAAARSDVPALCAEVRDLRAALERERMELASASVSVSRARELTLAQEIRANNLSAALERARALLEELVACGYECEAGALENNTAYRELAALLAPAGGAE